MPVSWLMFAQHQNMFFFVIDDCVAFAQQQRMLLSSNKKIVNGAHVGRKSEQRSFYGPEWYMVLDRARMSIFVVHVAVWFRIN